MQVLCILSRVASVPPPFSGAGRTNRINGDISSSLFKTLLKAELREGELTHILYQTSLAKEGRLRDVLNSDTILMVECPSCI